MNDGDWDGYVVFAGEDPLAVDFDSAAADVDLRTALPALLRVEVEIVAPDDQGLPSPLEVRQLAYEEQQLTSLLTRHETRARLVARATCRGTRELVVALPEAGRADFVLRKWSRKLDRECAAEVLEEGWTFVDEHLLPGPAERTWMAARDAVVSALEGGADPAARAELVIEGHPTRPVPLDPFAIAAALGAGTQGAPWRLELL
jgi:hypothetical protein